MKMTNKRPYADPELAARRLIQHARALGPIQECRIHIEKLNAPSLYVDKGTPTEYLTGLNVAIERGWVKMHESGTLVRFEQAGSDLFA
jgi:hypothetical protein